MIKIRTFKIVLASIFHFINYRYFYTAIAARTHGTVGTDDLKYGSLVQIQNNIMNYDVIDVSIVGIPILNCDL